MAQQAEFNFQQPWERGLLDREASWAAFVVWLDMSSPRTLAKLSRRLKARHTPVATVTLRKYHADCLWAERTLAYDQHREARRLARVQELLEEDARDTVGAHLSLIRRLQDMSSRVIGEWEKQFQEGVPLRGWNPRDVARMVEGMIRLERAIRGEPSDRVEVHTTVDLGQLSREELHQLKALQKRVKS